MKTGKHGKHEYIDDDTHGLSGDIRPFMWALVPTEVGLAVTPSTVDTIISFLSLFPRSSRTDTKSVE